MLLTDNHQPAGNYRTNGMNCPTCYRFMTHYRTKLKRSHAKEIRLMMYRCDVCKTRQIQESRRYPGDPFEVYRVIRQLGVAG